MICLLLLRFDARDGILVKNYVSNIIHHSISKKKWDFQKIYIDLSCRMCYIRKYLWKWGFLFVRIFRFSRAKIRRFVSREAISTGQRACIHE